MAKKNELPEYKVKYIDGRNGKYHTESVPCGTNAIGAICKAAHKMLHGAKKLTTYQLVSIDDEALPYDLALICW